MLIRGFGRTKEEAMEDFELELNYFSKKLETGEIMNYKKCVWCTFIKRLFSSMWEWIRHETPFYIGFFGILLVLVFLFSLLSETIQLIICTVVLGGLVLVVFWVVGMMIKEWIVDNWQRAEGECEERMIDD